MFVIIFGVSGAGKTTIGELLAGELGWRFYDADDFHPRANIEKMRRGSPLNDADREPWLAQLRRRIEQSLKVNENAVLACSALKKVYREQLRVNDTVRFVFLRGDRERIVEQLRHRGGHFMNPALLESQFADLEEPAPGEEVITIDLKGTPDELVGEIREQLLGSDRAGSHA